MVAVPEKNNRARKYGDFVLPRNRFVANQTVGNALEAALETAVKHHAEVARKCRGDNARKADNYKPKYIKSTPQRLSGARNVCHCELTCYCAANLLPVVSSHLSAALSV